MQFDLYYRRKNNESCVLADIWPKTKEITDNFIIDKWYDIFRDGDIVLVKDIEKATDLPLAIRKMFLNRDTRSLVGQILRIGKERLGFLGIENPSKETMALSNEILPILGNYVTLMLKNRNSDFNLVPSMR